MFPHHSSPYYGTSKLLQNLCRILPNVDPVTSSFRLPLFIFLHRSWRRKLIACKLSSSRKSLWMYVICGSPLPSNQWTRVLFKLPTLAHLWYLYPRLNHLNTHQVPQCLFFYITTTNIQPSISCDHIRPPLWKVDNGLVYVHFLPRGKNLVTATPIQKECPLS